MREITQGDIHAAARVLMAYPPDTRAAIMARLLARAHQGDCYRKAQARLHPCLGNGTLMAAAQLQLPPAMRTRQPPRPSDADWLNCVAVVIAALLDWRHAHNPG